MLRQLKIQKILKNVNYDEPGVLGIII